MTLLALLTGWTLIAFIFALLFSPWLSQKLAAGASGAEATGRTHTRGSVIQFKGRAT